MHSSVFFSEATEKDESVSEEEEEELEEEEEEEEEKKLEAERWKIYKVAFMQL